MDRVAPERNKPWLLPCLKLQGNTEKAGIYMGKWIKPNAWVNSPQADDVAEYYTQGHSVTETAEHFGVSKHQVNNLAKARNLTNGKQWQMARVKQQKAEAEQKLISHLNECGFDYLGGYDGKDSKATIRCRECKTEFERTVSYLRKNDIVCSECKKREIEKRNKKRKEIAVQQAEVKRLEKEWHRVTHPPKDYYSDTHEAFLNRTGICEICGQPYTVQSYMESCGLKYARDNGVCSEECRRKKANNSVRASRKRRGVKDNHRARARKYGCEYDSSVTLPKLIKRDGLRCAICGEMCDWNDHSWSKYSGPLYPSIDHIIPMVKGGGHTWDNVQVAHIICNSEKGDKLDEAV